MEAVWSDVTVGAQFDRQHYSWDQVHRTLGLGISRDLCNKLLDWLIERRIVFQGYKFSCANCGMGRWYSINRLADTQSCDGCGITTAKPIKVDQLPWRYRLNEAIAQAVDQGVLPHLLAVNRMVAWLHDGRAPFSVSCPAFNSRLAIRRNSKRSKWISSPLRVGGSSSVNANAEATDLRSRLLSGSRP